jgi:hypothetical protein
MMNYLVLAELVQCPEPKRSILFTFLGEIDYKPFPETPESIELAEEYLKHELLDGSSS